MSVTLTDAAARHVTRFISRRGKGVGVRLGVKTTGCSGLAYKLEYADEIAPEEHKAKCVTDTVVRIRREETNEEVAQPVECSGEGSLLCARPQGERLTNNDPDEGAPCRCE